jgi:hypothetical protein
MSALLKDFVWRHAFALSIAHGKAFPAYKP